MADVRRDGLRHQLSLFIISSLGSALPWARYTSANHEIVDILKWLTVALLAYVISAIVLRPDWIAILRATFIQAGRTAVKRGRHWLLSSGRPSALIFFSGRLRHEVELRQGTERLRRVWTRAEMRREMGNAGPYNRRWYVLFQPRHVLRYLNCRP
jgi:hypothetical protein